MFYTYFPLENSLLTKWALSHCVCVCVCVCVCECVSAFGYLKFNYEFYNKFCLLVYHFHIALKFPILSF